MEKSCTTCLEIKDISEFYKKNGGLYGTHAQCKKCAKNRDKAIRDRRSESAKKLKYFKDSVRKKSLDSLHPDYSDFIVIDERVKEKFLKMNESQINVLAFIIAENLKETQKKLQDDILKRSKS